MHEKLHKVRSCTIKLADYKWRSCLDTVSSERGRLIVKVEWEWRERKAVRREVLPEVARAKRPNGNEGRREGGGSIQLFSRAKKWREIKWIAEREGRTRTEGGAGGGNI